MNYFIADMHFGHEMRKNAYMIHGHIHAETNIDFFSILRTRERVLNAGVDINNFIPVTLEELIENNIKFKNRLCID